MEVLYSEGVFEELVEISYHLALTDEKHAQKFLDSCDKTFRLLAENKFAGYARATKLPKLAGIRFFPITAFPRYLIAYMPLKDGVRILHVFHGSTDYRSRFKLG